MFEIARAQGKHAAYLGGPVAGVACARVVTWQIGCLSLHIAALRLTDRSFEPPWGCAQAIPSPQKDACTGPWGLVRVRKPETEETTMVRRADFHNVSRIAGAVSARAPSGSASLTDLQIAYLPPERLRPSPNNARTHSKKQLKQIARSIERFGFVNPVLISDDFEIIAGHGRVEAAKILGLRQVPTVRLSNLSPADRRAYVITDNRLAELAGWDRELLASELQGLLELQFDDIELTGFSLGEIDLMLDEAAEKKAEEPGPEDELPANSLQGPAVSRAGDLWVLGPHRLLCGEDLALHPTVKPTALVADAIRDVTRRGAIVLDPFAGYGTTIIAAEKTGRHGRAIELDPLYCDVIVRRWQQYTGKAARLEGSDLTFEDVAATRLAGQSASTA